MKKNLKKALLAVCCAALLVCVSIGATVAYLTSQTKTVVNTFTVGKVEIDLTETDVKPDGTKNSEERVRANEYHLLPNHTYIKDPTVTIKAGSEESYVRMKVEVENISKLKEVFPNDVAEDGTFLLQSFVNGTWNADVWNCVSCTTSTTKTDTVVYEFRYATKVPAASTDTNLPALFTQIKVPETVTGEQIAKLKLVKINIVAEAIQADSFANPDAAWAAYGASNT